MSAREIFYIFVKASEANQFCAVRQDQPIPAMLDGVNWLYAGFTDHLRCPPLGFDIDRAHEATSRHGIYFYQRRLVFARGNLLLEAA